MPGRPPRKRLPAIRTRQHEKQIHTGPAVEKRAPDVPTADTDFGRRRALGPQAVTRHDEQDREGPQTVESRLLARLHRKGQVAYRKAHRKKPQKTSTDLHTRQLNALLNK
jgi:hypothetical protein